MGDKSEKQKFLSDLLECIREGKKFYMRVKNLFLLKR